MTITNELTILGGFLTFENDASLVQINETAINSGNITYKRESASVRPSDYSYWSSPVADQTLAAAFPTLLPIEFIPMMRSQLPKIGDGKRHQQLCQREQVILFRAPNEWQQSSWQL
jgi:hypothetical protein